ncbi:restriction endonuclease subunit S [Burkholderia cenocepacia]|uniref:Type I restriction modification DNA specificity domain-containing protein n=1 Tax=Burkholderia cenocepacia TaxID=95486 RepID=A0A3Q9F5I2_9BURK|nr:restriction endonuclease subunit S [Burkholderia cenocepacia]AZQ49528.1 hypothetical protein D5R55_00035 [Burkholderia cenocepacia]
MSSNQDLPDGWIQCQLGDVVSYGVVEKVEPNEIESNSWILELEDIEKGNSRIKKKARFFERQIKSTKNKFYAGDVLYGKLRPYLNKVVRADEDGFCTTEIIPLRPPEGIDSRYLFYWLKHPVFLEYVTAVSHGLNMPRLGTQAGRNAPFILAPRKEQQNIANKLDSLLASVDICRDRLIAVLSIIKRFREAVLSAAITGKLTSEWRSTDLSSESVKEALAKHRSRVANAKFNKNIIEGSVHSEDADDHDGELVEWAAALPKSWAVGRGAEIVEAGADIVYGIVQPGPKLNEGVPYIRGMDIVDGEILVNQLQLTSPEIASRYTRSELRGGDVLLGIIRSTKVALVPDSLNGANITQGTARFRPSSVIRSKYLAIALEAPETQEWLHSHFRGIDMPGLNLADVRRVPISIPPISEQDEIIKKVDLLFRLCEKIRRRATDAYKKIEDLTPSILVKAFKGELVESEPHDESAEVLLERIKQSSKKMGAMRTRKAPNGRATVKELDKNSLSQTIERMPSKEFTFEELRALSRANYEDLKGELFALLAAKQPVIEQYFDDENETIKLRRVKK